MRNLRMLSPVLRRLMPGLEIKDVLAELAERVIEECDYELEAANHRRIARFWRGHPFIRVPARRHLAQPPPGAGHRVGRRDRLRRGRRASPTPVRDRYAEIVYRFFYANAAELDVALGDPHPGNYLLRDDGRVAFFDFGMLRDAAARATCAARARVRGDPRRPTRPALRRGDARARLPARALGRVGRAAILSRACARPAGGSWTPSRAASPPRTCGAAASRFATAAAGRRLRADAPDDAAARGAAAAADGGPAVPDRLDRARRGRLGRAARASWSRAASRRPSSGASTPPGSPSAADRSRPRSC